MPSSLYIFWMSYFYNLKLFPPSNMILHALQASPIASLDDCFEDDNTNPKFYSILTYILSCTSFCYIVSCIFHCFLFRQNRMFTTVISLKTFMSQNINSFLNLSACLCISWNLNWYNSKSLYFTEFLLRMIVRMPKFYITTRWCMASKAVMLKCNVLHF